MGVAIFELDSAQERVVETLIDAGELPAIAAIRGSGARIPLHADAAYCAEYPATAFLTARSAEDNRYWSTLSFDPGTYTCTRMGSAEIEPFYARARDASVLLFDVPHSVVSPDLRGTQIVGWGGHDARFQYPRTSVPPALIDEIDTRFGTDPSVTVEYTGSWWEPDYLERLATALEIAARRHADIAEWLLSKDGNADIVLVGFSEPHSAGHVMAHCTEPDHPLAGTATADVARATLTRVYRAVDEALGRIVAALPHDTAVCVFSPKGMEATRGDLAGGVLLPELLLRLDLGRRLLHEPAHERWAADGCPPVVPPAGTTAKTWLRQRSVDGRGPQRRLRSRLPAPAKRAVRRVQRGARTPVSPWVSSIERQPVSLYRRYWPQMRAFAIPSFADGHIRLNVAGRERDGRVPLAEYDAVCDEIERELRAAVDVRTGLPFVRDVIRVRADDPMASDGPSADLVVRFTVAADAVRHPTAGTIGPFPFPRTGSHTAEGFAYLAGPSIAPGERDEQPVTALGPAVLELLR